jgi:hypothetical protein
MATVAAWLWRVESLSAWRSPPAMLWASAEPWLWWMAQVVVVLSRRRLARAIAVHRHRHLIAAATPA